ncbi:MAG: ABC transporter substrate-binding protein [Candidatus Nezhaarchaeales archaeon]
MSFLPLSKKVLVAIIVVVVIAVVGGLSYALITAPTPAPAPAPAPVEKKPIKIALLYNPAISVLKAQGEAAKVAIEEIQKAGGIAGYPVEYREWDTQRKVDVAVAAYREAVVDWGAHFVLLEGVSEEMLALMEEGAKLYPKYPHILGYVGMAAEVTIKVMEEYDKYKFAFRFFDADYTANVLRPLAIFWEAKNVLKVSKIALLIEEAAWTLGARQGLEMTVTLKTPEVTKTIRISQKPLRELAREMGLTVVYEANIPVGTKEFLPFLEGAKAAGAEYIFAMTSWYTDCITLVKQWAASGARDIYLVLYGGPNHWTVFWNLTGGAALGVMSGVFDVPDYVPVSPYTQPFIAKMLERGLRVDMSAHYYYSAVYHFKRAVEYVVERGGSPFDIDAVIRALERVPCEEHTLLPAEMAILGSLDENFHSYPACVPPLYQFQRDGKVVCISSVENPFRQVPEELARRYFHPELAKSPAELRAGG